MDHSGLANVLLQYERWEDIVRYAETSSYLDAAKKDDLDEKLKRLRLLGRVRIGLGKQEDAAKQIAAVETLLNDKRAARYKAADEAEAKARADKKSDKDVAKAMADALAKKSPDLKKIENVLAELRGYAELAADKPAQAKAQFEKITDADGIFKDHLAARLLAGWRPRASGEDRP